MRKLGKRPLIVTILASLCLCLCSKALAGYSVTALLPENQVNPDVSYFDMQLMPGEEQTVYVNIKNKDNEEIRVSVEANTASTNGNGLIVYTYTEDRDISMETDFSDIVTPLETLITIPPNEAALAAFKLVAPQEPFSGDVLGGLMFTKLDQVKSDDESSVAIQNIYQYVIGMRLRGTGEPVTPQFELTGVQKGQTATETLVLTLRNPQPLVAQNMALSLAVYQKDTAGPVFIYEKENVRMAPNSTMNFNVRTVEKTVLESGVYSVSVDVTYDDELWHFDAPLVID